jgi:hypothetical protein
MCDFPFFLHFTQIKMRKIFVIAVLFLCVSVQAQWILGHSIRDTKAKFPSYTPKTGYTDGGIFYLEYETDLLTSWYYFDDDGYSYYCNVLPKTMDLVNYIISENNRDMVKIDEYTWNWYSNGLMAKIELKDYEGAFYFSALLIK